MEGKDDVYAGAWHFRGDSGRDQIDVFSGDNGKWFAAKGKCRTAFGDGKRI